MLATAPTASNTLVMSSARPLSWPGSLDPPYRNTDGRLRRADAIIMPGSDLSQPAKLTSASMRSACITVSTESAITSRLTSDARIPSWPIEMPSDTAMVLNSIGKPPAECTPSFACLASRSSGMLHGVTSFHDDATPTCVRSQSPSLMPMARSIARAGAFWNPSVTSVDRGFIVVMAAGYASGTAPRDSNTDRPRGSYAPAMSSSRRTIDRQIAAVAIPAALALATDPLYDLCDTAILGHIGTAQLAGAALATRILAFGYAAFVFLMFGDHDSLNYYGGRPVLLLSYTM